MSSSFRSYIRLTYFLYLSNTPGTSTRFRLDATAALITVAPGVLVNRVKLGVVVVRASPVGGPARLDRLDRPVGLQGRCESYISHCQLPLSGLALEDVQPGFSARAVAGDGHRGGEPTPRSMYAARYSRGKRGNGGADGQQVAGPGGRYPTSKLGFLPNDVGYKLHQCGFPRYTAPLDRASTARLQILV